VGECVDTVLEEAENLKRLADEFSLYARLPAPQRQPVDLAELLRQVTELYLGRTGVEARWIGFDGAARVSADPGQLRQVFANLVKNGAEAMEGRGELSLELRRKPGRVAVLIRDTGPGPGAQPEALFEPYFTTKPSGTGLGLAISRKIVEDHGGRLDAAAAAGGGAEFRVELPVSESEEEA
jgi:nitrogen fixation/metabolism regulation signal transduction histidine kinase